MRTLVRTKPAHLVNSALAGGARGEASARGSLCLARVRRERKGGDKAPDRQAWAGCGRVFVGG